MAAEERVKLLANDHSQRPPLPPPPVAPISVDEPLPLCPYSVELEVSDDEYYK